MAGAVWRSEAVADRLYFLVGDIVSNATTGACAGFACALVINPGWHMFTAMLGGMLIGMAVALLLVFPLMRYFGAMEVMLPVMLSGMVAAMIVAMMASMTALSLSAGLRWGAGCGLSALAFCAYADYLIRGAQAMQREGRGGS